MTKYIMSTSVAYHRTFDDGDQMAGVGLDSVYIVSATATITHRAVEDDKVDVELSVTGRKRISRGRLSKRVLPVELTHMAKVAILHLMADETGNSRLRDEANALTPIIEERDDELLD